MVAQDLRGRAARHVEVRTELQVLQALAGLTAALLDARSLRALVQGGLGGQEAPPVKR